MTLALHRGPEAFLADWEARVRPLRIAENQAYWAFAVGGGAAARDRWQRCAEDVSGLQGDPATYEAVSRWSQDDPHDQRLGVLLRALRPHQGPSALRRRILELSVRIEDAHTTHRAELDGKRLSDNEVDGLLLRQTRDADRRRTWLATRQVGQRVEADVRELARLRNELARGLGYADHLAMAWDNTELDAAWLAGILDRLERDTDPAWQRLLARLRTEHAAARGKPEGDLMPWDFADRFFQSVPRPQDASAIDGWFRPSTIQRYARAWFSAIGMPLAGVWEASDLLPRAGKQPHAFCLAVDAPQDVRVLCNLGVSQRWMEIALHEFGHAAYDRHLDGRLPWLLRQVAHDFVTEGVAMFCGRLARTPEWLERFAGVPGERLPPGRLAETQLVFLRWALVVPRFEARLFADPDGDLDTAWWDLVGRLQGLPRPDGARADWASKVHVACLPGYYQNYVLGELLASQMKGAAQRSFGAGWFAHEDLGTWMVDLFRRGRSAPWPAAVEGWIGQPLAADAWLAEFAGLPA